MPSDSITIADALKLSTSKFETVVLSASTAVKPANRFATVTFFDTGVPDGSSTIANTSDACTDVNSPNAEILTSTNLLYLPLYCIYSFRMFYFSI